MKMNKIIFTLMAAFSLLAVSCQTEEPAYVPGEPDLENCHGVYFPSQEAAGSHAIDPSAPKSVEVVVKRLTEDGDITVPVVVEASAEGIFQVSELKFVDGQTESSVTVTFDKAEAGVNYVLNLSITDPAYASVYSQYPTYFTYEVIIERYDLLGTATYREDIITALFTLNGVPEWQCEVYTKETNPGVYYFKNLYTSMCPLNKPGEYVEEDVYFTVDASDPSKVYIPAQPLGWDWGYGMAWAGSLCPEAGFNVAEGAYGTLIDGVIEFPVQGIVFAMEGHNNMTFYYGNGSGLARFLLPGAVLVDYSLAIHSALSENGVLPVRFTFGTDIAKVKYAIYSGTLNNADITEKAKAIAKGDETNVAEIDQPSALEDGTIPVVWEGITLDATGEYTIVAVGYDASGVVQVQESHNINYVAAGDAVPVNVTAGLGSAEKYAPFGISTETAVEFYIYGEDLVDLKFGCYTVMDMADTQAVANDVMNTPSISSTNLEAVNNGVYSDVIDKLTPGTEHYLVVWATNGYEQTIIVSDPWTTDGDPLPVYASYSIADVKDELCPASSDGFFGTYNYYGVDLFKEGASLREYLGQVTISDSELPDSEADENGNKSEYVDVQGIFGYEGGYFGFDDTMTMEYYGGVLYTTKTYYPKSESGHYPAVLPYVGASGSLANPMNYAMIAGFVAEGYLAFVDNNSPYGFTGLFLGMFGDEAYSSYAGHGGGYNDILLINPANDDNGLAPAPSQSARLSSRDLEIVNKNFQLIDNYVETERGRMHSAIDKMNANKVNSVGTMAGLTGMWESSSVEFTSTSVDFVPATDDIKSMKTAENANVTLR